MCPKPKIEAPKSLVAAPPPQPEAPPDPVKIDKDGDAKVKRRRNPLRIDLRGSGNAPSSGVNV